VLIPERGYRDIYRAITDPVPGFDDGSGGSSDYPYSGLIAITFTY
jgi:hypothetical protein